MHFACCVEFVHFIPSSLSVPQGSLPPSMDARLLKPSGRGRKPRNAGTLHSSMMGSGVDFPLHAGMAGMAGFPGAAGLMAGGFPKFPMGMPFANLAGLGMTNPMLGLAAAAAGFQLPGFPVPGKEGEEGQEGGSKDKAPSTSTATTSAADTTTTSSASAAAAPHPSFPGFFFNPMAFNPLLASQLRNYPIPGFPNLAQHVAALNGLSEGAVEDEYPPASRKEKKSHMLSKSEKGHDLTRVVEKIRDMSRSSVSSHHKSSSSSSSGAGVQDLTMKRAKNSSPSPAHSKGSKASSTSSTPAQDQATDLSIKVRPSPSPTSATTPTGKSKNKIHKSFSLNRIVDSLKEKIEEKSKKKEDGPGKEEEEEGGSVGARSTAKDHTKLKACPAKDSAKSTALSSEKGGPDDARAKVSETAAPNDGSAKVTEQTQPEIVDQDECVLAKVTDESQPETVEQDDVLTKVTDKSQPEKVDQEDVLAKVTDKSQPATVAQDDVVATVTDKSQPETVAQDDVVATVTDKSQPEKVDQDDVLTKVTDKSQPAAVDQDGVSAKVTDKPQQKSSSCDKSAAERCEAEPSTPHSPLAARKVPDSDTEPSSKLSGSGEEQKSSPQEEEQLCEEGDKKLCQEEENISL